ncbi:MAG TPA: UvrD-helicase domain-containing protein [Gammaproteobacteria bacterium]|jgi:ATP-dependent exoDNAse (exonuclease V) beta subunit|nr:UvrD-helicase domain-containing protein [Gammaproteobacteria bacterium]
MNTELHTEDALHRRIALDTSQSFIVQAPAGSGKTELLIQRFLSLLSRVNAPEEILAITFTKKAANEMRLRVIKALQYAAHEKEPADPHHQKRWHLAKKVLMRDADLGWHLIDNPNQLRIQTMDAFCAYLTKQLPLLSHFGSQPDLTDDHKEIYGEAVRMVLSHVEEDVAWSDAIATLLLHVDNDLNKLNDLIVNLLANRDQWISYIHFEMTDDMIRHVLENQIEAVVADNLVYAEKSVPDTIVSDLLEVLRFAASHVAEGSHIRLCENLKTLPGTHLSDQPYWLGIATLLLTKSLTWRKRVDQEIGFPPLSSIKNKDEKKKHEYYRNKLSSLIESLSHNENMRNALSELFLLPEAGYHDSQWEVLQSLMMVLKVAVAQLRVCFQKYGCIDFIENAQAALTALGSEDSPTDLTLALDYRINHMLIDEFQDTSISQYQLIKMLIAGWEENDGRTLFLVGDPMQSIYQFRNAEVGLFMRMHEQGIAHIKLTPLILRLNFRSTDAIVEWNNASFKKIFPHFNNIAVGAVTYTPSLSDIAPGDDSVVKVTGLLDGSDQAQAQKIIETIRDIKSKDEKEKIAILVRSRSHLKKIILALKSAAIAYHAVDIDPLCERQWILDLQSLTRALIHPADRVAWLSVLRAPWCGLCLSDLLIIAGESSSLIWNQMRNKDVLSQLSEDGRNRINKLLSVLKSKMDERDRHTLRVWIESTWLLIGGPATLPDESDYEDVTAYFQLLEQCTESGQCVDVEKLDKKIATLYSSTSSHSDYAIEIMTIHAAKGLEFDTVIVPHLEKKMPYDEKSLLSWMEYPLSQQHIALLLAPIHAIGNQSDKLYDYIRKKRRLKSYYEVDRLLYVAMTRAKKRLYLFFNKKENRIEQNSFLEKYWPAIEDISHNLITQTAHSVVVSPDSARERKIARLDCDWANPITDLSSTKVSQHAQSQGFALLSETPVILGKCVHHVLETIAKHGVEWWEMREDVSRRMYLRRYFFQSGLEICAMDEAIEKVLIAISQTLSDPRGRWILQPHREARSEYALSAVVEEELENIVIDRTFIDENNVRWIIDYKTSSFSEGTMETFLQKELDKYTEKMKQYAEVFSLMEKRPIKMGLYFPLLPAWVTVE